MKNKITLIIAALVLSITSLMAQSPGTINYQGVARDTSGNPIANQQIRLRFKINDASANGPTEFTEVRKVTTSSAGLFNCQIGGTGAISQSASLLSLPWHDGPKFLKVEMDPTGGAIYTNLGSQQLASVPYALHARTAETFKLPFNGVDGTIGNTFAITNTDNDGASHAIRGDANGGIGVFGNSNSVQGVYGSTNSASYAGVFGYNYNAAGTGVQGRSYQGIGVFGDAFGAGIGVKGKSVGPTSIGVLGENTTGIGVKGISNATHGVVGGSYTADSAGVLGFNLNLNGIGVHGRTANGNGVFGEAQADGIGVYGRVSSTSTGYGVLGVGNTLNSVGVKGVSMLGTALNGVSSNGYGLDVEGKVKISGGNTNPGKGKVLTSDSVGNATWEGAVAFSASIPPSPTIASGTYTNVNFNSELYDLSNNFNTSTYRFTAPVKGIYHFDCQIGWQSALSATFTGQMSLLRINSGNTYNYGSSSMKVVSDIVGYSSLSKDVMLEAGDIVYVQVYQSSGSNKFLYSDTYFNGRLVVKL